MNEPLVTVAVPVFNTGPYLRQCIESIINQTFSDWELIAVDDGSTDDSLEILKSFSNERIKIYKNGCNKGPGYTRNFIVAHARGQYIALQDSDDYMGPNRLKEQVNVLRQNPTIDLVGSRMTLIGKGGEVTGTRGSMRQHFDVQGILFRSIAPAHATLMGKTSWFARNPYPEQLRRAEDRYMIVNAVGNLDFNYAAVETPFYFYRYSGSLDLQKRLLAYQVERKVLIRFLPNYIQRVFYFLFSALKTLTTIFRQLIQKVADCDEKK